MAWVYILTLATWKYYIWSTTNIEQRIKEHQSWKSIYTKNKNPELLFQKEYNN
jgi:predicted GIY-YIG superfamily endonuclease